jgi:hypothetical protein
MQPTVNKEDVDYDDDEDSMQVCHRRRNNIPME